LKNIKQQSSYFS
jgi:hypothetical protein